MNALCGRESRCIFNGIDAETGEYLLAPSSVATVRSALGSGPFKPWDRGARFGVDFRDLRSAGWAVLFPRDGDPAVRQALAPLLALRRRQAEARRAGLYRELHGEEGYRPGETADDLLVRHGVGPGVADPGKLPYYLLLVGGPEEIPFEVQLQLDVQYGVGRIGFDSPDDYARYAESVVVAEEGGLRRPPRLALWGPANPNDGSTALSSQHLVGGLARALTAEDGGGGIPGWTVESWSGEEATKERLSRLLGGPETPALLFTASHGLGFSCGHPQQRDAQGALLCQEWPGPGTGRVSREQCFVAGDLGSDARVAGLISFHFACYGGGTPEQDEFSHRAGWLPRRLTPRPFVARLPQRLAAHPSGGALAVVGHLERAWSFSFEWRHLTDQIVAFESALEALMAGWPVGAAMEFFGQRCGDLAMKLLAALQLKERGQGHSPAAVLGLWTALNDARSYAVFGDPAVRLPVVLEPVTPAPVTPP